MKESDTSRWRRLGWIGNPAGSAPWALTHAALPVTEPSGPGRWHVYVSCRDAAGRAHIGRCELCLDPTPTLSALSPDPVLAPGPLGAFDDSGVTMSCLVSDGTDKWLYYTGWTRGVTVPFYLFTGVARSTDGGQTFVRASKAPALDRSDDDPYLNASPCVLIEGGVWRMWYISATRWDGGGQAPRHYYHVKYTESDTGAHWRRPRRVAIDYASPDEYAFGRPCVVAHDGGYRMWYSFRGHSYRIGGAESADGLSWTRRDEELGLAPAATWESGMVEYPWIFDWQGRRYMLYNGNDYGRTGLGLAVWE